MTTLGKGLSGALLIAGLWASAAPAFVDAFTLISRRIDLLLGLPLEKLERMVLEARLRAIGAGGLPS